MSVRPGPDYGQAQAAAAAATGQPLMAQTAIPPAQQTPYTLQYMPPAMMAPSAQGVYPQVCVLSSIADMLQYLSMIYLLLEHNLSKRV